MNILSPTGLREIEASDTSTWMTHADYNTDRLNDTLLKVSGMADVEVTNPQELDSLLWNSGLQKYVNEDRWYTTTTTTTVSSTTTSSSASTTSTMSSTSTTATA
jgi:hypothetical protein